MSTIKVLVVPPDAPLHTREVGDDLETFQALVGGYIEPVGYMGRYAYVDEDGLAKRLPLNQVATRLLSRPIVGTAVFVGTHDGEETDVPDHVLTAALTVTAVLREAALVEAKRNPIDEAITMLREAGFQVIPPRPNAKPRVRRDAPDTSKAVEPKLGSAQGRVLALLRRWSQEPPGGCTDDELEEELGLTHQSTSAARRNLVLRGLVRATDERRNTRSGNKAIVWKAVVL